MSAFHEAIKQIFADVDRFITLLKEENLSKSAQKERTKIANSLQKIFNDYESINPHTDEGSSNSSKDDSRFTSGSIHSHGSHGSEEDADNIPYATVKSLTDASKLGYLIRKPTDLLEKLSKTKQKKYCVVHKSVMYWFQKPSDKKHQGAIYLADYEFKDVSPSEKELVFELSGPKKKVHQFQAESKDDFTSWQQAIETGIKFIEHIEEIPIEEDGENYEPIDEIANALKSRKLSGSASNPPGPSPMKASITATALPPLPSQESEQPQELYEDAVSTSNTSDALSPTAKTEKIKPTATSTPNNLKNSAAKTTTTTNRQSEEFDEIEEFEEIYEIVGSPPTNNKSEAPDDSRLSAPSLPPPRPPLPTPPSSQQEPPPLPERGANIPAPPGERPGDDNKTQAKTLHPKLDINTKIPMEEDYENMFYGNWACVAGSDNELSFDRGDLIHILNRDLDSDQWWIGERCGDIGLVPKTYLIPAYELVA